MHGGIYSYVWQEWIGTLNNYVHVAEHSMQIKREK